MKKIIFFLILVISVFSFVACGDENRPGPGDDPNPNEQNNNDDKRKVTTTNVVTYKGPSILSSSSKAKVSINNEDLFVYETRVNSGRVFTFSEKKMSFIPLVIFDFQGKVTVKVTLLEETSLTDVKVTPASYGINPSVEGNVVTFDLSYPTTYTLEYNNQTDQVVHLIAREIEKEVPDENNIPDNMIYIGPGVYKADAISIKSNQTLYIAGGAVVYGQICAGNVENITIRGRGIISGEIYPRTVSNEFTIPFDIQRSKNVKLEGVTFLDPAGWTLNSYFLDGFVVDNVAIISGRGNGDGVSLQSCKRVEVKNCFVRTWDDSIVVKNYSNGTSDDIYVHDTLIWTDLAQSMEIGYECYGETMNNIRFENITVLHNFHKAAISIHNADQASITNVSFKNITIEDASMNGDNAKEDHDNFLIDFQVLYNLQWTSSGQTRGTINNVIVDDVLVLKKIDVLNSKVNGFDKEHMAENVALKNITIEDKKIKTQADLNLTTSYTSNVDVSFTKDKSTGAIINYPYVLDLKDDLVHITSKENAIQYGFMVPEFSIGEISEVYMGTRVKGEFTAQVTHGTKASVWDDESGLYDGISANSIIDGDYETSFNGLPWNENISRDYVALTINLDVPKTIGTIRLYGDQQSKLYYTQSISVYGVKANSTTGVFTKISNQDNYEFSPKNGNFADIVLNPGEFKAIQIRIFHKTGGAYPKVAYLNEVELYPASLSFNKVVYGTAHEDVYNIENLVDGSTKTYYESSKEHGFTTSVEIIVDLGDVYDIKYINLYLVPLMSWEARTQVITISVSVDGNNYTDIVDRKNCLFDPTTGNVVEIILEMPEQAKYVRFNVYSNTASGNVGAQLSEIAVYE